MATTEPKKDQTPAKPWAKRLGWLVLIWGASVVGLGLFAALLKWVMVAIGMSPPLG